MSIEEMMSDSKAKGSYWFSPSNMRFFGTVIETEPNAFGQFITSECDLMGHVWNGERRYTIRQYNKANGSVDDISMFGEFNTLDDALERM